MTCAQLDTDLMAAISLHDRLGPALVGRFPGSELRAEIEEAVRDGQQVVVDFTGVAVISPSFADEVFAKLDRSLVEQGIIRFENLDEDLLEVATFARHIRSA